MSPLPWDAEGAELPDARAVRVGVAAVAAAAGVLAQVSDPGTVAGAALVAVAVAALLGWAWRPRSPTVVLSIAVLVPVVLATRSGQLEPALFLVSVLAWVVAWFERSTARAVAMGGVAAAAPVLVALLVPTDEGFSWWSWVLGIVLPWLVGRLVRRQLELVATLDAARAELAARAVTAERQRLARDVHDLVGHGLAAVLLQITSARHVLRRDADAADQALAAAEAAGRRSMGELRRTMALLRSDGDGAFAAPAVGLDGVGELVRDAAERGLRVRQEITGEVSRVGEGVALAVQRVVQESLANAVQHAPQAVTTVAVAVGARDVAVEVASIGPVRPAAGDDRPRYGLVGMRERAEVVGGELSAGPTPQGWVVRGRLPLDGPP